MDARPSVPPRPDFLIIGAQKCATRWLRANLGQHPDVYTAPNELAYFSSGPRYGELGPFWYRAQFEGWEGQDHVGEATPAYLMPRHHPWRVARRIDQTLPNVRLVAVLRDPIDRAQSALVHHIHRGRLASDDRLVDVVGRVDPRRDELNIVSGGWYERNLRPFWRRFGDRLLIVWYDDLERDPTSAYRSVLRHIGASTDFVPDDLARVRYSTRDRVPHHPLEPGDREALWPLFERDVLRLERRTGRDLAAWRPDRSRGADR